MSEIKSRPYFSPNWRMRNTKLKKKLAEFLMILASVSI